MSMVVLTSAQEERNRIASIHVGVSSSRIKSLDVEPCTTALQTLGMNGIMLNQPAPGYASPAQDSPHDDHT